MDLLCKHVCGEVHDLAICLIYQYFSLPLFFSMARALVVHPNGKLLLRNIFASMKLVSVIYSVGIFVLTILKVNRNSDPVMVQMVYYSVKVIQVDYRSLFPLTQILDSNSWLHGNKSKGHEKNLKEFQFGHGLYLCKITLLVLSQLWTYWHSWHG